MTTPITPKNGYAFKHKTTCDISLMLFLGTGDSIDNYDEISDEEYHKIMGHQNEGDLS
jgi:hypothetical protein